MDPSRERLADAVEARRDELELSWEEVADRADLVVRTIWRIRRGEGEISRRTAAKLERGLEWPAGTVSALLAGEPLPATTAPPRERADTAVLVLEDDWEIEAWSLRRLPEQIRLEMIMEHRRKLAENVQPLGRSSEKSLESGTAS